MTDVAEIAALEKRDRAELRKLLLDWRAFKRRINLFIRIKAHLTRKDHA